MASSVYLPFCVETTGGLGKDAKTVLRELSKVVFPGDDEDPHVRLGRAVWRVQVTTEHAFDLVRRRERIMFEKFNMIAKALDGREPKRRRDCRRRRQNECRSSHDADARASRAGFTWRSARAG